MSSVETFFSVWFERIWKQLLFWWERWAIKDEIERKIGYFFSEGKSISYFYYSEDYSQVWPSFTSIISLSLPISALDSSMFLFCSRAKVWRSSNIVFEFSSLKDCILNN